MVDDENDDGYFVTKFIRGRIFSEVGAAGVCLQTVVVGYVVSCY